MYIILWKELFKFIIHFVTLYFIFQLKITHKAERKNLRQIINLLVLHLCKNIILIKPELTFNFMNSEFKQNHNFITFSNVHTLIKQHYTLSKIKITITYSQHFPHFITLHNNKLSNQTPNQSKIHTQVVSTFTQPRQYKAASIDGIFTKTVIIRGQFVVWKAAQSGRNYSPDVPHNIPMYIESIRDGR